MAISGLAQTNERVSEFLRNTLYNSTWLERPELVEIRRANPRPARAAKGGRDQRRLYDFSMRVTIPRRQQATTLPPGIPRCSGVAEDGNESELR